MKVTFKKAVSMHKDNWKSSIFLINSELFPVTTNYELEFECD